MPLTVTGWSKVTVTSMWAPIVLYAPAGWFVNATPETAGIAIRLATAWPAKSATSFPVPSCSGLSSSTLA